MNDFKVIESSQNSVIKHICKLQVSSKERYESGLFVIEGLRICKDACENGIRFNKFIVSEEAINKFYDEIKAFAENSCECIKVTDSLFRKISDTKNPQGIAAVASMPDNSSNNINLKGRYIALENISDPSNLGAVARTAEALGASGIILSADGCDPYSPKVLRASMGTLLRVPLIMLKDFSGQIGKLGLKLYSCVVDKEAQSITNAGFQDGCAVIIGNEANGVTAETKKVSDLLITIPMQGAAESLNAAAAAAISIWEMMKV